MLFCKQDRECPGRGAEFVAMNPGAVDFHDFSKLAVRKVRFDKCPLAVWFWCGTHHIPSSLVFDAIDICHAYLQLDSARDLGKWVFIDAPDCWLEAIALSRPEVCHSTRDVVISCGVLNLLGDSQFNLSHTELSKVYPYKGMPKQCVWEKKADLYDYIKRVPNPTIDGFRHEIHAKFSSRNRGWK